ncbi:hypothetical protein DH86_00003376 [Scytalidium sp. 3C]|nr:hypothetical protein DH86_00003376 [Scytalidium sp. 3C]
MNGFGFIEYKDAMDARDDLKDFARQSSLDVVYSETGRDRDGKGPSRISLVTTAPDLVRLKVAEAMMTTIAADLVDIAPVATVIGLHLTVGVTMMMTVAATDLHRELVAQLMTIHHRAVVVSMILTVVTTLLQTHTRMAMVDHHMTDLLPETIHRVILDTVMTIVVPATGSMLGFGKFSAMNGDVDIYIVQVLAFVVMFTVS